jgi:hypothetical protein
MDEQQRQVDAVTYREAGEADPARRELRRDTGVSSAGDRPAGP